MEVFYMIIRNPTVVIILVISIVFKLMPPKSINAAYGYRTPASMKSEARWKFAQEYSANLALIYTFMVFLIQIVLYIILGSSAFTDLSVIGLWVVSMVIVIVSTEKKLKQIN